LTTLIDSTDGVQVALHDFGGTGPPLLIVHATGFHGWCYEPIARRLTNRFHVMAPDLRGHGDSIFADGSSMDWWNLAADLSAVVEYLGPNTAIRAVGHSMGGATIMMAELMRPNTFSDAWLFEPIAIPDMPEMPANPMAENARRRRERFDSREDVFNRYSSRPPFRDIDHDALHAYIDHGFADNPEGGVILKCRGEIEAQVYENTATDLFGRLGAINTKVTVVGSGDGGMPAQVAPMVADALPDSQFVTWPDNSHFGPFEDPSKAAGQILEHMT